jgi:hypothetical protein
MSTSSIVSRFHEKVAELARHADDYFEVVSDLPDQGWKPAYQVEARIARTALAVLTVSDRIKLLGTEAGRRLMPREVERAMTRLGSIVRAHLLQWGWLYILVPEGDALISERVEAFQQQRYLPLLRAALAWRSMDGVRDHSRADRLADEAESLGLEPLELPPGTSPEAAEELTLRMHREWAGTPALGPDLPTVTEEELTGFAFASDRIGSYARHVSL